MCAGVGAAEHVTALGARRLRDGLAIGDLEPADLGVDAELAAQAIDEDLEVELAHAGDGGGAGLRVDADAERRILLGQPLQGLGQLVLVGLGLRLHGNVDDGIGEVDRLQHHRGVLRAQRVFFLVVLRARGDVIDVQVLVLCAPVLVRVVEPSDGPLLDWPFGAALVLARGFALVLGGRVGAEVATAGRPARPATG